MGKAIWLRVFALWRLLWSSLGKALCIMTPSQEEAFKGLLGECLKVVLIYFYFMAMKCPFSAHVVAEDPKRWTDHMVRRILNGLGRME